MSNIFIIVSILVPFVLVYGLPIVLRFYFHKPSVSKTPLYIAGFLFLISWYLPSPLIEGENTYFVTHFVGGGLFTGFVWLYVTRYLRLGDDFLVSFIRIYFLVSALGVANELFEMFVTKIGLANLTSFDTWWDLVANTSGAILFWIFYNTYKLFNKR